MSDINCITCEKVGPPDTMALIYLPGSELGVYVCSPRCAGKHIETVMDRPQYDLAYLAVACDGETCDLDIRGDIKVERSADRATRLGAILDHAARFGWRIEGRDNPITAKSFCPRHA